MQLCAGRSFFAAFSFVTRPIRTLMSGGTVSPLIAFTAISTGDSAHLVGKLRDRCLHRPVRDRLARIVQRIEAEDADLAGLAARQRSPRSRRAPSCRCRRRRVSMSGCACSMFWKTLKPWSRSQFAVCDATIVMPGAVLDRVAEAADARVAGLVAGDALEHSRRWPCRPSFHEVLADRAARRRSCRSRRSSTILTPASAAALLVEPRIDDHHRDVRAHWPCTIAGTTSREPRGRERERADPRLDQVLDDLHLPLDVDLALGRLHDEIDARAACAASSAPRCMSMKNGLFSVFITSAMRGRPVSRPGAAIAGAGHGEHDRTTSRRRFRWTWCCSVGVAAASCDFNACRALQCSSLSLPRLERHVDQHRNDDDERRSRPAAGTTTRPADSARSAARP